MILGFVVGVVFVALLIFAFAAGYALAVSKIKPLDEEQELNDRRDR